jgi:hypothetical protein
VERQPVGLGHRVPPPLRLTHYVTGIDMTDTTMNTGAASLSDERERAAITACALMIKGICLTRPNAEWTGAIEDRIQFMLKQMQADAAIAAGGAQEAAQSWIDGVAAELWAISDVSGFDDFKLAVGGFLIATALPRVAATVWQPIETAPKTGRTLLLGYLNSTGKWRTVRGQWMSEAYISEQWEEPDDAEPGWYETSVEADDPPNCWPIEPTHWMPLPAAPAASNGEQA